MVATYDFPMAYDLGLAEDVRAHIGTRADVTEKTMFGGLAFLIGGNMAVGVNGADLMVRVGKDDHEEAIARPGARTMDFTGRPMEGWVVVAPEGTSNDAALEAWIEQGIAFAAGLPPK